MFREEVLREAAVLAFMDVAVVAASRYRWLGAADRDDLRSAGYLAVVRGLREYDPARGPFAPFVRACVENAVRKELKALAPSGCALDGCDLAVPGPEPGGLDFLEGRERALAALLLAGYGKSEAARVLGVSPAVVTRLCRRLARRLGGGAEGWAT